MKTLRTIAELRATLEPPRRAGAAIGLVPTMGALHDGHLALMHRARQECDVVVVSLFVNPAQFNETSDLAAYPRDEARDKAMTAATGADYLFAPDESEVYPPGFAVTVSVGELTERLEGAARGRSHFDGVTTVVTKLLNITQPDVAYFGQKDAQQAAVVRKLVRDLNLPVRIEACATVREPDGLALSSRNVQLSADERERASSLSRSLATAAALVAAGERDAATVRSSAEAVLEAAGALIEYFQLVDTDTFVPVDQIDGPVLAVVAARIGSTRLIDNQLLTTVGAQIAAAGSTNHWRP